MIDPFIIYLIGVGIGMFCGWCLSELWRINERVQAYLLRKLKENRERLREEKVKVK